MKCAECAVSQPEKGEIKDYAVRWRAGERQQQAITFLACCTSGTDSGPES